MLNVTTTRDYLKYTLTLSGVGFAYISTALAAKSSMFDVETALVRWVIGLLMLAFFLSTLFGVFAISGTVRYENEMAGVPPQAAGAVMPQKSEAAEKALNSVRMYANLHLVALIVAFLGAAVFFVEGFLYPPQPARRCTISAGSAGLSLAFDCDADVAKAVVVQGGRVKQ